MSLREYEPLTVVRNDTAHQARATWVVTRPSLDDVFMTYTGRTIRDSEAPHGSGFPFAGRR